MRDPEYREVADRDGALHARAPQLVALMSEMGAFFRAGKKDGRLPLKMHGAHSVRSLKWKSPVASAPVPLRLLASFLRCLCRMETGTTYSGGIVPSRRPPSPH